MKHLFLTTVFCLISAAAWANPCQTNDDCPGSTNICDQGQCTTPGTGECTTNDDCPGTDNICDQGSCWCVGTNCGQDGVATHSKNIFKALLNRTHDLCEANGDCNGGHCTAAGVCQDGGTGAPCDQDNQCANGFCWADGTCQ